MTNLVFEGFGRDERVAEERSQWFTDSALAFRMWRWSGLAEVSTVLEPSAGSGNLVAAARLSRLSSDGNVFASTAHVTAHELDSYYVDRLRERFAGDSLVDVRSGNYLAAPTPDVRFNLGLSNPPFEDGLDGLFVAKMMDECERIIALIRLVALAGKGRHRDVWSRIGKDWWMPGLAIFSERPEFQAGRAVGDRREGDSAKADFCVVKLSRTPCARTSLEWW